MEQNPEELEISERSLDVTVAAMLVSSADFRQRFLSEIDIMRYSEARGGSFEYADVDGRRIYGQTDVWARWRNSDGSVLDVLMENKLTAAFQPEQGARYSRRAASLIHSGDADEVKTVLIAPARYARSSNPDVIEFDFVLDLADLHQWAVQDPSVEMAGHALFLAEAIRRIEASNAVGTHGWHARAYRLLSDACARRSSGIAISNHNTGWVFFDHPVREVGVTIRYRFGERWAELALKPNFQGNREAALAAAQSEFTTAISGSYQFIRTFIPGVSELSRRGDINESDAALIVSEVDQLLDWWRDLGRPAAGAG